jgi:hypothetical protein
MRYVYHFKDSVDVIVNSGLSRQQYHNFIEELKIINSTYSYQIYLAGSYLSYLTRMSNTYNDIDFFIMAEKIIDLDELTEFCKKFHQLAKKYGFIYDLIYYVDADSEDLNMDPYIYQILTVEETRIFKLYSKKVPERSVFTGKTLILVDETELFEGVYKMKTETRKTIDKKQKNQIFQKPLKIS